MSDWAIYRNDTICTRWVLRESRARWLVRSIPPREDQAVHYERRWLGFRVSIVDVYDVTPHHEEGRPGRGAPQEGEAPTTGRTTR